MSQNLGSDVLPAHSLKCVCLLKLTIVDSKLDAESSLGGLSDLSRYSFDKTRRLITHVY